jgi:hypothetical protein
LIRRDDGFSQIASSRRWFGAGFLVRPIDSRVRTQAQVEILYANSTHRHGNHGHRWKRWTKKCAPFPKELETASEETRAAVLAGELQPHVEDVANLHEAERWRDTLLSGDESQLAAFVERYPACDRAHVRLLVRNARRELELDKPPNSVRELFRYVRRLSDPRD